MRLSLASSLLLTVAVMVAGCQTVTTGGHASGAGGGGGGFEGGMEGLNGRTTSLGGAPVVMPRQDDSAIDQDDPCVENLENLTGALLAFAAIKHRLPESLSELPATFAGEKLSLSCPVDNKPYVYYPNGLHAPRELSPKTMHADGSPVEGNMLILVDADAAHQITRHLTNGEKDWDVKEKVRYGIVMEPPEQGRAVKLYVIPVEQKLLDMYLKEQPRQQGGGVRQAAPGGAW